MKTNELEQWQKNERFTVVLIDNRRAHVLNQAAYKTVDNDDVDGGGDGGGGGGGDG